MMKTQRRKHNRLKGYDYSVPGYYFVTISTWNHCPYFGEINNGQVRLNSLGLIAQRFWIEIPTHYNTIAIDVFTILPDHIHGIIVIEEINNVGTAQWAVPTVGLSTIINSYKGAVTKTVHTQMPNNNFGWQRSFYDHIIRSDEALNQIRQYIVNNPLKHFLQQNT